MREMRWLASWALALFLVAMLLWIADLSLFPRAPEKNVVFPMLAEYSGIALFEPAGRLAAGVAHVIAALFLLLPLTRRFGALLSLAVTGGALAAHALWLGTSIPAAMGSTETDGGQLFYLTLALAAASLLLVFVHPGRARAE